MAIERPEYQQRVITECDELAGRLERLRAFTLTPAWQTVDAQEQERLGRQETIMLDYLGVLRERIAAFTA